MPNISRVSVAFMPAAFTVIATCTSLLAGALFFYYLRRTHRTILSQIAAVKSNGFAYRFSADLPQLVNLQHAGKVLESVPAHTILLLLFHEDERFFAHKGVNYQEVLASVSKSIQSRKLRGGSSISQQVVRMLLMPKGSAEVRRGYRKIQELIYTWYLEYHLTKIEILALYITNIHFWQKIHGIEQAAHFIFHKPPSALTVAESEILASLIPGGYRRFKKLQRSAFRDQIYDFNLSYERLLALLRWLRLHIPAYTFSVARPATIPFAHLVALLAGTPLSPEALSITEERALQIEAAKVVEQISIALGTSAKTPVRPYCRYLCGAPLLLLNLIGDSEPSADSQFSEYLLSVASDTMINDTVDLAARHRLAGIIAHHPRMDKFPQAFAGKIRELQRNELATHLRQRSALAALDALLSGQCPYILLKGLDLHDRLYSEGAPRPGGDIDIIISANDFPKVAELLNASTYRRLYSTNDATVLTLALAGGEAAPWLDPALQTPIDIHIYESTQFERLLASSLPRTLEKSGLALSCRSLPDRDLLLYLCHHASKHGWNRLIWLQDINRMLKLFTKDEIDSIMQSELEQSGNLELILSVQLVKRLFRINSDQLPVIPVAVRAPVNSLFNRVIPEIFSNTPRNLHGIKQLSHVLALETKIERKISAAQKFLFRPTHNDLAECQEPLSEEMFWLYGAMRPIRGIMRYLQRR